MSLVAGNGAGTLNGSPPTREPQPAPPRRPLVPDGFDVRLPEWLLKQAHTEAIRRYRLRHDKEPRSRRPHEYVWHNHMEGAPAEAAYALFQGVVWVPSPGPDGESGDVCGDHVKGTAAVPGHLIVRPEEQPWRYPTKRYVLLVGALARWRVVGWLPGSAIRDAERWRTPGDRKEPRGCRNPSWWHPADTLRDPVELRRGEW